MNAPAGIRIDPAHRPLFRAPDPVIAPGRLQQSQFRLMVVMMLFMLVTLAVALRLTQFAIFGGDDEANVGAPVRPRADIFDRNGIPLATTIKAWSIAINPQQILGDKNQLARDLARLIPEKSEADYRKILFSKKKFVFLKEEAVPALVAQIHALGEPGIMELRVPERLFPQAALAGHLLGYSQQVADAKGKEELTGIGIERYFDKQLSSGESIQLSIDTRVQAALESEIARRIAETSAAGGAGVILDVHTGEVMALASLPDINPNAHAHYNNVDMANKVTQSAFELGSTFKMLTFANAIEHGVLSDMSQKWDVTHVIQIGSHAIHDDEPMHRAITTPEVMTYSSNIGTAKIAEQIGEERIKHFFRELGFFDRTGIELRERGAPIVPRDWGRSTIMTTAFGHGLAVTPLHLAQAYAALVNGGILHPATLVKHKPGEKIAAKRVISEATSARMRQLMRLVVLQGTGTNADAPGLRVGGKTGTAEKVVNGRYVKNANVTTFSGAFPMDDPQYVVLVVMDDAKAIKAAPGVQSTYGFKTAGWMTAPLAKRVIRRVGPLLGVRPELNRDIDVSDLMPLLLEKKVPGKNAYE
ncbi:penicillin-binding protein 2 [Sphingomonas sp. BIUV-7]|uniref:Penicillin-binding protein 2 n=1 Tax=Sphingomonas natans TaxID=3063330 RepID=A0ABT8Y5A0_9SPHN|nr:penicillin-binding protein 2 [Sphingomonas sp. BIUV-7]MDO6413493.1 penicillin-binding protein 2 [Sphingomonas sp. BIUV-7]